MKLNVWQTTGGNGNATRIVNEIQPLHTLLINNTGMDSRSSTNTHALARKQIKFLKTIHLQVQIDGRIMPSI